MSLQINAGVSVGDSFSADAVWSTTGSVTEVDLVDVTGDGLPDYLWRFPGKPLYVQVNEGYGFSKPQVWAVPGSGTGLALPGPFAALAQLPAEKLVSGIFGPNETLDALEATGSVSKEPQVGFSTTLAIPIGPGTPWVYIGFGETQEADEISSSQVSFMDVNGDGFADQVIKEQGLADGSDTKMYVRESQLAGGNLLSEIKRPLGGRIELATSPPATPWTCPEPAGCSLRSR